jgi:organic hydroperoxide reductase OsmC/OhrA
LKIRAHVQSEQDHHRVSISTNGNTRPIEIPPKPSGLGSSVNGGELLFLALATCYCNDIYREAAASGGIDVLGVEVEVEGDFEGVGEPATNIIYRAKVRSKDATREQIKSLLERTDKVAEIQNTLRQGVSVRLVDVG